MKFVKIETAPHEINHYHFRITQSELESMLTSLDLTLNMLPSNPATPELDVIRRRMRSLKRSFKLGLKELNK